MNKGETFLINQGLYVSLPINLMILLDTSETYVLSVIRHCNNVGETHISLSAIQDLTGLSDKTIRRARDRLFDMGFIKQGSVCKNGTHYDIDYNKLCNAIAQLNKIKSPSERLVAADKIRGVGFEIHNNKK